ncbi:MAG: cell division protein FtsB [Xanthomonadaceae bacterium]|nr:cell division protein FtsB [Xanthomonadaceae bacterium]MDE1959923.1 cell division protein FtsB [Xanthomonadaceae bacterium]MDE2178071.1 cell division protein FtsB [Xanthomonadaceae bacterium]MDE2246909.1 cell division protein FtsB [Xanthomonadaceae bacterium]
MLRWIAVVLLVLVALLQLRLWTGAGGMRAVSQLRTQLTAQQAENLRLQQRNQTLGAEVEDLKHGNQAVEAHARSELGLIKPGETFYQVVNPDPRAATAPATSTSARGG